jgi:hypothetical protein
MQVRLRFERVYGTLSQYGNTPRESPVGSPITLNEYPLPSEKVTIYLGQPVEELYRTYNIARAGGFTLVRRTVMHENITDAEEKSTLERAQTEGLHDDLTRWNWYITILIERTIEIPDAKYNPARWFSIDSGIAIRAEREFLEYGAYQIQFLVDHLASFIPRHFFATREIEDRVVFFAGEGAPFRVPQVTVGDATTFTSSPIERCDIQGIQDALYRLQSEGQIELTPLTPPTLLTLVERATNSDLKGRALEELVSKLFLTIPGLGVISRIKTATEEIDIGIFNDTDNGFLASEGAVILAECKNWSSKCGRDEFSLLEKKTENRRDRCSLSFLISWNGFTGTIEKELLRSSRQRLVIVPLTGDDLRKAVNDNNFFEVIQSAWRNVIFT